MGWPDMGCHGYGPWTAEADDLLGAVGPAGQPGRRASVAIRRGSHFLALTAVIYMGRALMGRRLLMVVCRSGNNGNVPGLQGLCEYRSSERRPERGAATGRRLLFELRTTRSLRFRGQSWAKGQRGQTLGFCV